MKRRSFLLGGSALAVSGLISGCSERLQATLRVRLLRDSIPPQLLNEFRKVVNKGVGLDFAAEAQLDILFDRLQSWQKKPEAKNWWSQLPLPFVKQKERSIADAIAVGDYWLAEAIAKKLIQPLDPTQLNQWKQLPSRWQDLVRRNEKGELDPKGKIWGAPYRWGSTVIVYRKDKFKSLGLKPPTDWSDLWREELRDRISLLDQPREVIGLTLKKLGQSYNTEQLDKIPNLKEELKALQQQVKFYSNNTYLQPLILGDTWLAVGWSTDVFPVLQRYQNTIGAVIPQSGTSLWADVWVRPVNANPDIDLMQKWIDFCWQPEYAVLLSRFGKAISPIFAGKEVAELPNTLRRRQLILPTPDIYKKSEFLLPLPQETIAQYQSLWREIRFQGLGIRDRSGEEA